MAASVQVKKEELGPVDLENRIVELCEEMPHGISDQIIQNTMPQFDATQRVMAINRLLSTGQISLLKSGTSLLYRLNRAGPPTTAAANKGGDHEERLVYQIIEDGGNKGIWIRDIRFKSNLLLTQVNKILKNLESKKLIKAVKAVNAAKKKVYMLYNLEPDRSVTGGAWYSDHEFESEFVDVLNQQCLKFLEQKAASARDSAVGPLAQRNAAFSPSQDVWRFITELGISKVQLSVEDIECILDTLIYDGKVESSLAPGRSGEAGTKLYRQVRALISHTPLVSTPCGICPVISECRDGGAISPATCIYMKDWLNF